MKPPKPKYKNIIKLSKLEMLLKGTDIITVIEDMLKQGGSLTQIYKRKWYNPLYWILSKHGIRKYKYKDIIDKL